uniref:A-amastin n=1 Tax=Angomonas deanei TaxID=59799 RepID=C6K3T6_9TRYP|nr:a-amastin [Angomonas deanei]
MSQVARAKKMFDDVSSDEDSKNSNAAAPSAAVPVQHADPHVETPAAPPQDEHQAEKDPNAFVAKSTSPSQAREGAADEDGEAAESANDGATMVTRVEVSPPPKEASVAKVKPADTLNASSTTHAAHAVSNATPPKAASSAAGAAAAPASAAAVPSSSYSTPATVSKRQPEREEREAHVESSATRRGKEKGTASTTKRDSHYKERTAPQEEVAFSTTAKPHESRTTRRQREEYEMQSATPYSATSVRKETAAHSSKKRPRTDETTRQRGGGLPVFPYVFPRLDPALADYQGSRTAVGAAKRGKEFPPNACERSLSYLMVTDLRMAVYLGVLFLSIVFVIVSIPTSQLDMTGKSCFTYWGFKSDCDSATYTYTRPLYPCSNIRSRLGAGAAFSIITLVLYIINFTAVVIVICCLKSAPHKISLTSRIVVGVLGFFIVVTQLISWAVVAGIHSSHYCLEKGVLAFGVGFGLNLTSWIMNLLGIVLVTAIPSDFVNRHQRS